MDRCLPALALALLVLLAPATATAGTEAEPEIDDGLDRAPPNGNLLVAWFETVDDGLRFTIKIESIRSPQTDMFYLVAFTLDGERVLAGMGWDEDAAFRGYVGDTSAGRGGRGLETFANERMDIDVRFGSPAYLTGTIPFREIDGLERGATIENLHAGVTRLERSQRAWFDVDPRSTTNAYTIEGRAPLLPLSLDLPVPVWMLVGAMVGGGGAAAIAHRLRKAA